MKKEKKQDEDAEPTNSEAQNHQSRNGNGNGNGSGNRKKVKNKNKNKMNPHQRRSHAFCAKHKDNLPISIRSMELSAPSMTEIRIRMDDPGNISTTMTNSPNKLSPTLIASASSASNNKPLPFNVLKQKSLSPPSMKSVRFAIADTMDPPAILRTANRYRTNSANRRMNATYTDKLKKNISVRSISTDNYTDNGSDIEYDHDDENLDHIPPLTLAANSTGFTSYTITIEGIEMPRITNTNKHTQEIINYIKRPSLTVESGYRSDGGQHDTQLKQGSFGGVEVLGDDDDDDDAKLEGLLTEDEDDDSDMRILMDDVFKETPDDVPWNDDNKGLHCFIEQTAENNNCNKNDNNINKQDESISNEDQVIIKSVHVSGH